MYEVFYKLRAEPFRLSPDHNFCYAHKGYAKARAYMAYAFKRAEGFVMITGRPGTGKTTLIGELIESLADDNVVLANLVCTQLGADDLLKAVAYSFGIASEEVGKAELLQRLTVLLHRCHREGRRALLMVDEAQDLSSSAMEELRLLTNIQKGGQPLLQIFLLGQTELRDLILSSEMEQVHQRIVAASHLESLEADETEAYVLHRLHQVGWQGDPALSRAIFPLLFKFSEGVPRRINLICSRLFLHGSVEQRHSIDVSDVRVVIRELQAENLAAGSGFSEDDFATHGEPEWVTGRAEVVEESVQVEEAAQIEQQAQVEVSPRVEVPPQVEESDPFLESVQAEEPARIEKPAQMIEPEKSPLRDLGRVDSESIPKKKENPSVAVITPPVERLTPVKSQVPDRRGSGLGAADTANPPPRPVVPEAASRYTRPAEKPHSPRMRAARSASSALSWRRALLPGGVLILMIALIFFLEVMISPGGDGSLPDSEFSPANTGGATAESFLSNSGSQLVPEVTAASNSQRHSDDADQEVTGANAIAGVSAGEMIQSDANRSKVSDDGDQNLTVSPLILEKIFRVKFPFDSVALLPESRTILDEAAAKMQGRNSVALIMGFSDNQGNAVYNLELAHRRAAAVQQYLIDVGIERARLKVDGRIAFPEHGGQPTELDLERYRSVQVTISRVRSS